MDKLSELIAEAFKITDNDYRQVLESVAEHCRQNTNFFSEDYKKVLSLIFTVKSDANLSDSALQRTVSTSFNGSINKSNKSGTPDKSIGHKSANTTQAHDNSIDMFNDDDLCDDSIIPETQCSVSDSEIDAEISTQHPAKEEPSSAFAMSKHIEFNASTSTLKSAELDDATNDSHKSDGTDNSDDFAYVGQDSTQYEMMQSQAIFANIPDFLIQEEPTLPPQSGKPATSVESNELEILANKSKVSVGADDQAHEKQMIDQRSDMVTPDLDDEAFSNGVENIIDKSNDKHKSDESINSSSDESLFDMCTQVVKEKTPRKPVAPSKRLSDVFEASTQVADHSSPKKNEGQQTTNDSSNENPDDIFSACTQKVGKNVDEIFDACTQKATPSKKKEPQQTTKESTDVEWDDIFDACTQKVAHSDENTDDIYDACTQKVKSPNFVVPTKRAVRSSITPIETKRVTDRCRSARNTSSPNDSKKPNKEASPAGKIGKRTNDVSILDQPTQVAPKKGTDIFEADTQPIEAPQDSEDIFEMLTQKTSSPAPKQKPEEKVKKHVHFDASASDQSEQSDDIFEQATQTLPTVRSTKTPMTSSSKAVPEPPSIRSTHKVVPDTPEWSVTKKLSKTNIESYEQTSTRLPQIDAGGSDEENDIDDLDFDFEVRSKSNPEVKSAEVVKAEPKLNHFKRQNEKHDSSASANISAHLITSNILKRRCSVSLTRIPLDEYHGVEVVDTKKISAKRPKLDHIENNNVSDNKTKPTSRSSANKTTTKQSHDNDTKRKTREVKPTETKMDRPRRLRGNASTTTSGSSKSKRRINYSDEDDTENDDDNRNGSRSKNSHTKDKMVPTRTSARAKSYKESIDKQAPHALDIDTLMSFDSSRRSRTHRTSEVDKEKRLNILITKVEPSISKSFGRIIQKLGGYSVDTPQIGDILICDKVYRTFKFLFALCKGIPIVRSEWLEVSNKNGRFEPTDPYLLIDKDSEKRFNFKLKESIAAARRKKLFADYQIFTTPNVQPIPDEIAEIVQYCGGVYSYSLLDKVKSNAKLILFSHKKDRNLWPKYENAFPHIDIVDCEGFMQSVMKQRISLSDHFLC